MDSKLYKLAYSLLDKHETQIAEVRRLHKQIGLIMDPSYEIPIQYSSTYPDKQEIDSSVKRYLEVRLEGRFDDEPFMGLFVQNRQFGNIIWEGITTTTSAKNILRRELSITTILALFLWTYADLSTENDEGIVNAQLQPEIKHHEKEREEEGEEEGDVIEASVSKSKQIDTKISYIVDRIEFLEKYRHYIWFRKEVPSIDEEKTAIFINLEKPGEVMLQNKNGSLKPVLITTKSMTSTLRQLFKDDRLQRREDAVDILTETLDSKCCLFCSSFCTKKLLGTNLFFCAKSCYNMYKGK